MANNNLQEIRGENSECSRSKEEEGGPTFIEHVSVDRDLNEGFDQPSHECGKRCVGEVGDWWCNGRSGDETRVYYKNSQKEDLDKTSQWESHNYAWGWLSPSHPSDPRMTERYVNHKFCKFTLLTLFE